MRGRIDRLRPQLHGSSAMIDVDIVRKVALSLPEVEDRSTQSGLKFYVRGKQFAWTYLDRVEAKGPRRRDWTCSPSAARLKKKRTCWPPRWRSSSRPSTIEAFRRSWLDSIRSMRVNCGRC